MELTLGPYTVRVVSDEQTDIALAEDGHEGDSDVRRGIIRVRSDLDHARRREVLVHELLHHVIHLTHLAVKWSDDEQEEAIRALSPWLAMVVTVGLSD
ncbi:MAG TPA: ImmA/IrrE family metallo-endopeptidase [Acidimicrobiia bacterium]